MKPIDSTINEVCCKKMKHSVWWGKSYTSKCTKKATYTNGTHFFCKHHSGMGRYVFRVGDVGEILARYDTEQELHDNAHLYPDARMQKITKSHKKDIYRKPQTNLN